MKFTGKITEFMKMANVNDEPRVRIVVGFATKMTRNAREYPVAGDIHFNIHPMFVENWRLGEVITLNLDAPAANT